MARYRVCRPAPTKPYRRIGSRVLPGRTLATIRRLREPLTQATALLAGPDLYSNDGDGFVYEHARVPIPVWNAFQEGKISWVTVLTKMEIKVGHTNDLGRRLGEYDDCTPGYVFLWQCAYSTSRRMLLERLVHLSLRYLGAKLRPYRCYGCGTRHREYYDFIRAGGFAGVEKIIREWLWRMGEVGSVKSSWSQRQKLLIQMCVINQASRGLSR
ncbi:hypothetical protein C8R46DRAFT_1048248 [Mycena filopes]|nr:hypothetical protein C8R46DRAFT_1048248 [Mycena filopes]